MEGGKVRSPTCLGGPGLPFSFRTLPTPIPREGGAAPAPHRHSSQWDNNHRPGERKGLVYLRDHPKKTFKSEDEYDIDIVRVSNGLFD